MDRKESMSSVDAEKGPSPVVEVDAVDEGRREYDFTPEEVDAYELDPEVSKAVRRAYVSTSYISLTYTNLKFGYAQLRPTDHARDLLHVPLLGSRQR